MNRKLMWVLGSMVVVALITLSSLTGLVLARRHHGADVKKPPATEQKLEKRKVFTNAPYITAHAAIMVNVDTGEVLYEKNADEWMYPASMTKIVTALIALEQGDPGRRVVVSKNAADTEGTYMNEGDVLKLRDMVVEMMLISDNGAAVAIAENIAGSVPEFARLMNKKAKEFGAKRTNFVNPNGLPEGNHISSARDMLQIAMGCWKNEELRKIAGTIKQNVYWINPAKQMIEAENTNDLLEDYPGTLGFKTGWTNAAGGCLVAVCQRQGLTVMTVTMHSESGDDRFTDTARLFDYAFYNSAKISH